MKTTTNTIYSLKEKNDFILSAERLIFQAIDDDRDVDIALSVGDARLEIPMAAECWNALTDAIDNCYESEYDYLKTVDHSMTTGGLIHRYLESEYDRAYKNLIPFINIYKRFLRAGKDESAMSDLVECIRLELDYRVSDTLAICKDFENGSLANTIECELRDFLLEKFEVCYSGSADKTFLMFYGDNDYGTFVNFVWGEAENFSDDMVDYVDEYIVTIKRELEREEN